MARLVVAAALAVASVATAACSGSQPGTVDAAPTTYPTAARAAAPADWVTVACKAVVEARDASGKVFAGLDPGSAMQTAAGRAELRTNVGKRLEAAAVSIDRADRALADAGQPETRNGDQLAEAFRSGLAELRGRYRTASRAVSEVPTGDADEFQRVLLAAIGNLDLAAPRLGEAVKLMQQDPSFTKARYEDDNCKQL